MMSGYLMSGYLMSGYLLLQLCDSAFFLMFLLCFHSGRRRSL